MCRKFWLGSLKGIYHTDDLGVDGGNYMKIDLRDIGWLYIGFIWLRIGTGGGLL
jgi:hypothetical protein